MNENLNADFGGRIIESHNENGIRVIDKFNTDYVSITPEMLQTLQTWRKKQDEQQKRGDDIHSKMAIAIEFINHRFEQDKKWGIQDHPGLDQVLLTRPGGCTPQRMCEEYDIPTENMAKQKCDNAFRKGEGTWAHILLEEFSEVVSQFDIEKQREELVQLGACVMAWIESIDRNK